VPDDTSPEKTNKEIHMSKLTTIRKTLAFIGIVGVFAATAGSAFAKDSQWQKNHPRREQVNMRLATQNKRIKNEVKEGDLSHAQAATLHKDDRKIAQEERDMAQQNGSHITRQEQKALNQQENVVSKKIGQ
jgi:CRISPR/Cas system-associated endoribonuclease Cas2